MPVVTSADQLTDILDVVEFWRTEFEDDKDQLGLNYVAAYDQKLTSDYPAILINPFPEEKVVHGTHTYLYTWRIAVYVLHAKASQDRLVRNKAMLELVRDIENWMEEDKTQGDRFIFSFVESKSPGVLPPFVTKSDMVLSTRMMWFATSEGRFK